MQAHQACRTAGSSSPLLNFGILHNVLSYVGCGHYLFAALVSTLWKDVYATLSHQQLTGVFCDSKLTLFSSVFASPSRVKFAEQNGLDCSSKAYEHAAGRHADILTFAAAHELGMKYTSSAIGGAAQCNKLAEVQYLRFQGCSWSKWLLEPAVEKGYFELVRWCREHGCPWNAGEVALRAVESGNVELMAWVLEQPDTQLHEDIMSAAASRGDTTMRQYLRARQCPWGTYSTLLAAHGCHAGVLSWLIDNGCTRWQRRSADTAAAARTAASTSLLTGMLNDAGARYQLAAAQWLREQGAEWPASLNRYWWRGRVLAWARAAGCTSSVSL
jgi:hypothetical protein